jgi:hypothetical protein
MTGSKTSVRDPSGRRRFIPLMVTVPGDEAMAAIRTVRTDRADIVRAMGETVRGTPDVLFVSLIPEGWESSLHKRKVCNLQVERHGILQCRINIDLLICNNNRLSSAIPSWLHIPFQLQQPST